VRRVVSSGLRRRAQQLRVPRFDEPPCGGDTSFRDSLRSSLLKKRFMYLTWHRVVDDGMCRVASGGRGFSTIRGAYTWDLPVGRATGALTTPPSATRRRRRRQKHRWCCVPCRGRCMRLAAKTRWTRQRPMMTYEYEGAVRVVAAEATQSYESDSDSPARIESALHSDRAPRRWASHAVMSLFPWHSFSSAIGAAGCQPSRRSDKSLPTTRCTTTTSS